MLYLTSFFHAFVCAVIFTTFLTISKDYVSACYSHDGFDSTTMSPNDFCSNMFTHDQCMYMQNVIKAVIAEIQQKMENQELAVDKKYDQLRVKFEKVIEDQKIEHEKDKSDFEEEKAIIFDQVLSIKKEVKLLKKQFEEKAQFPPTRVNIIKDVIQQNESIDHDERIPTNVFDDWLANLYYQDNGITNLTNIEQLPKNVYDNILSTVNDILHYTDDGITNLTNVSFFSYRYANHS